MSLNKAEVIRSPGYPHNNYERNTKYTWYVIASDDTEEISIDITTDIHEDPGSPCYDYLQVQEIKSSASNFNLFKRCGHHTTIITASANRLLITFISNDDKLTSKGFQLTLKVLKVGTTLTTRTTSTQSTTTKTRTTASTVKTTDRNGTHFNQKTVQYRRAKYCTCCRPVPAVHFIKVLGVNLVSLYRNLRKQSLHKA